MNRYALNLQPLKIESLRKKFEIQDENTINYAFGILCSKIYVSEKSDCYFIFFHK